jgi:hypothetical protein
MEIVWKQKSQRPWHRSSASSGGAGGQGLSYRRKWEHCGAFEVGVYMHLPPVFKDLFMNLMGEIEWYDEWNAIGFMGNIFSIADPER